MQCLSLAGLLKLVYCLWVWPGAYTRVEHLKGASLGKVLAISSNIRKGWKCLQGKKHSTLLQTVVNYGRKKFYDIIPSWAKCSKTVFLRQGQWRK